MASMHRFVLAAFLTCTGASAIPAVANCTFTNRPSTQYYWDKACEEHDADTTGCFADGKHKACRFCGTEPFPACPRCEFVNEPETPHVWDSNCGIDGVSTGCYADGVHRECRFCGPAFEPCPAGIGDSPQDVHQGACSFKTLPTTPFVWDAFCGWDGNLEGCFADGKNRECRFCGSDGYAPCPEAETQPAEVSASNLRGSNQKASFYP